MEAWEQKYVVENIEPFDQKFIMFSRPDWDVELRGQTDDWFMSVKSQNKKAGWGIKELALVAATGPLRGLLGLSNYRKPNPSRQTKTFKKALASLNPQMPGYSMKPPEDFELDIGEPQRISSIIKKVAKYFGADLVGICRLDRRWVYSHTYDVSPYFAGTSEKPLGLSEPQEIPETFQYAIILAFEMDYQLHRYMSSPLSGSPSGLGYSRMAITNSYLSEYIFNLGYQAINCTTNDVAMTIPMAMQAGLGDIGRNGLLITPQFGPRVRLSKIITDLPLVEDSPIDFGVTEFCMVCEKCADQCPSKSIIYGDRTGEPLNVSNVGGELKWPINAETCRMYWSKAKKGGCSICISSCPYNKVNTWPHRVVRWFADHVRWMDRLLVMGDNMLGYGKPRSAAKFWEEWQP